MSAPLSYRVRKFALSGMAAALLPSCGAAVKQPPKDQQAINLREGAYGFAYSGTMFPDGTLKHIIAARNVSPDQGVITLESVPVDGTEGRSLSVGSTVATASVQIAPAPPETVVFLNNMSFDNGVGTLMFADLSQAEGFATPVPGGTMTRVGGAFYGPTGSSLLFFGEYDANRGTGRALWSHGTDNPVTIGEDGDPGTVVVSRDRTSAIIGVNASYGTGLGDLLWVDLQTGATESIAQGVVLRARAYQQVDTRLSSAIEMAFAASPDGQSVAFAATDKSVKVWHRGSGLVTVATDGRFPAVSSDGQTVVYYDSNGISVWKGGTVVRRARALAGQLTPIISSDDRYAAYLTDFQQGGLHPLYSQTVGNVAIIDLGNSEKAPLNWGQNAAWHSVAFGPTGGRTSQVTMVANCRDMLGAHTFDGGVADFLMGDPSLVAPEPAVKVISPTLIPLPLSNGWVFAATENVFTTHVKFNVTLVSSKSNGVRTLAVGALNESIQSGAQIPTLSTSPSPHSDEILFLTPETRNPSFDEQGASLWGASEDGRTFKVQEHVIFGAIANDGRVLTVQAKEKSKDTTIWLLPFSAQ